MKRQPRPSALIPAAIAALALLASPARAGYTLEFDRSNYVATSGQAVAVSVYLVENDGNGTLASLGLIGAGVTVSFNVPGMVSDPAQATSILANPSVDPSNDLLSTSITPATATSTGSATLEWFLFSSPTIYPTGAQPEILIGTFNFTEGMMPGGVTNLSVNLASPSGSQFYLGDGTNIDAQIGGSTATITPSTVPEPSSLILVGIGLATLFTLARARPAAHPEGRARD
jgi:PEP-CTERM motif